MCGILWSLEFQLIDELLNNVKTDPTFFLRCYVSILVCYECT